MNFYWVNLGTTFKEVRDGKFLWAPTHTVTKKGKVSVPAHWITVGEVKKGDVIFCNANKKLIYVAIAKTDSYSAPRPPDRTFKEWNQEGNKVDVELQVLSSPIQHTEFKNEFVSRFNNNCHPAVFNKDLKVNQTYMCRIPQAAAILLQLQLRQSLLRDFDSPTDHLEVFTGKGDHRTTTVKARVGQSKFRSDVMAYWNSCCPITGIKLPELLTASHIYPWVLSGPEEKVDPANGIALSPAADRLFDRGYISIDSEGKVISSGYVCDADLTRLGIQVGKQVVGLTKRHFEYLKKHRSLFNFQ